MTANTTIDIILRIAFGGFAAMCGLWLLRPKHDRAVTKLKLGRRFGVSAAEMDALFKPCENVLFDGFNRVIAVLISLAGLGLLISALPFTGAKSLGLLSASGAIIAVLLIAGLQMVFTAKAFTYMRRLYWVNPATWRPGWMTSVEVVWGRLLGLVFVGFIGAIVFAIISTLIKPGS